MVTFPHQQLTTRIALVGNGTFYARFDKDQYGFFRLSQQVYEHPEMVGPVRDRRRNTHFRRLGWEPALLTRRLLIG